MKRFLYLFITISFLAPSIFSFAQFKEVDERKEFIGLTFLSLPDYSTLDYFKPGPDFNLYTLKKPKSFTTADYSISKIYITIKKGRVTDFICVIDSDKDFENIIKELKNTFPVQVELNEGTTYHGKNIIFLPQIGKTQKTIFIATMDIDTIPDLKDNSGITGLIGKKSSDPAVVQFISSISKKNEKKEYEGGYELTGTGFYAQFEGSGEDAKLKTITIYLAKDNYYYSKTPFKASIQLPYDITASTTIEQLKDKFGEEDRSNYTGERNYGKFKIKTLFGEIYDKKNSGGRRLIFLTIE